MFDPYPNEAKFALQAVRTAAQLSRRIQEEIAISIADALSVTLEEGGLAAQKVDPKAYDYFLRGLSYFGRHTMQDTVFARHARIGEAVAARLKPRKKSAPRPRKTAAGRKTAARKRT